MASVTKMQGKARKDPKTGKERPGVVSYKIRWYYPVEDGKAEEQTVTWRSYKDANTLAGIITARGGRVRKTDPDVLDHSIVTGTKTRTDEKPLGLTVPQLIDEFIAYKAKQNVKASTITAYTCGNRAGIVREYWADEYVSQLAVPLTEGGDPDEKALAFIVHIVMQGTDPRAPWQFFISLLTYAVRKGYIPLNPATGIKLPPRPEFLPRFLAQSEFELLLSYVDEDEDPEFWLLLVAAWETGLRLGELLGLERNDVTIVNDKAYITVRRTTAEDEKGHIYTTLPKNGKHRVVVVPVDLAERLVEPGRHAQRIFPALRNPRNHCRKKFYGERFDRIRELARTTGQEVITADGAVKVVRLTGQPPRIHDLRHSHASNQLGEGVDMYVVSKRLGHASILITVGIYGHLGKKAEDAQLAAITAHRVPSRRLGKPQEVVLSVAA